MQNTKCRFSKSVLNNCTNCQKSIEPFGIYNRTPKKKKILRNKIPSNFVGIMDVMETSLFFLVAVDFTIDPSQILVSRVEI
jgi:hypothetical protein